MHSSYTDQLHSAGVRAGRDDEGNDGPSSFETPEMNFTTEFITLQMITGIVHAKIRILSLFFYTLLCHSKIITLFLMKIKCNIDSCK